MRIQPHEFNRTRERKRRTQLNYARLQHQTHDKYLRSTRFNIETQELEVTLQDQSLGLPEMDLF